VGSGSPVAGIRVDLYRKILTSDLRPQTRVSDLFRLAQSALQAHEGLFRDPADGVFEHGLSHPYE
jgi:hypothetical protein